MDLTEELKKKTEQLKKTAEEINQLQKVINQNREVINQKTSDALKLDGAISVLKELQEKK